MSLCPRGLVISILFPVEAAEVISAAISKGVKAFIWAWGCCRPRPGAGELRVWVLFPRPAEAAPSLGTVCSAEAVLRIPPGSPGP